MQVATLIGGRPAADFRGCRERAEHDHRARGRRLPAAGRSPRGDGGPGIARLYRRGDPRDHAASRQPRARGAALRRHARDRRRAGRAQPARRSRRDDLKVLVQTFSLSSVYALPWILTFVLQRWHPEVLQVPQQAAAPLTLALMFSLIVSGGFVQPHRAQGDLLHRARPARHRRRSQPPHLAVGRRRPRRDRPSRRSALAPGTFDFAVRDPAALGATSDLLLGALWLTCGFLWLERRYWHVPAAFAGAALAFFAVRRIRASPLEAQLTAGGAALTIALALMGLALHTHRRAAQRRLALPRFAILGRASAPYFCYGIGYFAFVFADRIAAGSAVPTAAGVQFSVDAHYQAGMDTALLCFLISMAAVEFLNHRFIHFWQEEATRFTPATGAAFAPASAATACARGCSSPPPSGSPSSWSPCCRPRAKRCAIPLAAPVLALGLGGYLLLELALFNSLVLFSVNAPTEVLRALLAGLAVNAAGGYLLESFLRSAAGGVRDVRRRGDVPVAVRQGPGHGARPPGLRLLCGVTHDPGPAANRLARRRHRAPPGDSAPAGAACARIRLPASPSSPAPWSCSSSR